MDYFSNTDEAQKHYAKQKEYILYNATYMKF